MPRQPRRKQPQEPLGEQAPGKAEGSVGPGRLAYRDGIAWMVIDDLEKKVNTLSARLMDWFGERLAELEATPPEGLVILSGKPGSFVAGADIQELQELSDPAEVMALLERGHALMARLVALPSTTVAAIHGACLGGGLELALACDLRVATDHPATRLGLPEVQLGLIPGLGGTQRLPRLIGVPDALDLILTGRRVSAGKARRLGLVDDVCHPRALEEAALRMVSRGKPRSRAHRSLAKRAADLAARLPGTRDLVYDKAKKGVLKKTGGHYPAPLVAVEVIKEGLSLPLARALDFEAGAFSRLVVSDTARNLMTVFFTKNEVEARAAKIAKDARAVPRVGVLGAGFMGAGIAQLLAYKELPVVLKDKDLGALGRGLAQADGLFADLVKRRRYRPVERKLAMSRIQPTVDYRPLAGVDFVVEAVFEDLAVKQAVLKELEAVAPEGLIFASNTSTLPIARIAEASAHPENVVGMHFFSPVHKMPLLEVIRHPGTSREALATVVEVGRRMGKTVIVVNDGPGFYTSRVLGPFVNEAAWCLAQGASVERIDKALTDWGFPVGPLALLDEVGLDIARHAGEVMLESFGERFAPPPVLGRLIEDGRSGRKSGRGFYVYEAGKGKRVDDTVYSLIGWQAAEIPDEEIAERCWLQMLNETARSMEDGVIENPGDVDLAVLFGFGFPPFRGGILREADRRGLPWVVERLETYASRHGDRLAPAELLRTMASRGETFHGGE